MKIIMVILMDEFFKFANSSLHFVGLPFCHYFKFSNICSEGIGRDPGC